jgi:hypothetical protein
MVEDAAVVGETPPELVLDVTVAGLAGAVEDVVSLALLVPLSLPQAYVHKATNATFGTRRVWV